MWLVYDITESRFDLSFTMRAAYYMIFLDGHAISMCQTALPEDAAVASPATLDARFERLLPLCRMALNSLVLPQVYLR